jgi:hypothetical protein
MHFIKNNERCQSNFVYKDKHGCIIYDGIIFIGNKVYSFFITKNLHDKYTTQVLCIVIEMENSNAISE